MVYIATIVSVGSVLAFYLFLRLFTWGGRANILYIILQSLLKN